MLLLVYLNQVKCLIQHCMQVDMNNSIYMTSRSVHRPKGARLSAKLGIIESLGT